MDMPDADGVSREAILWCYRLFLGRAPASQKIADSHLARPSLENLRAFFATHPEFQAYLATLAPPAAPVAAIRPGRLDYIIDKIETAALIDTPFRHLYIENLFTDADFAELIGQPEINLPPMPNDAALLEALQRLNFKAINFPGTTTDIPAYLAWHADPSASKHTNQETCEGYGVVLRLQKTRPGSILEAANALFASDRFWNAAGARFGLHGADLKRDHGLQKYLDGYEISPHPDIRNKALTFMINVNAAADSERIAYHTQYLRFRPEREYVSKFWSMEPTADRSWVPWDWCEPQKTQRRNNSLVMFSPGSDTLHAVKANYDHLRTQRTQFYGNLWYKTRTTTWTPNFKALAKMAPG